MSASKAARAILKRGGKILKEITPNWFRNKRDFLLTVGSTAAAGIPMFHYASKKRIADQKLKYSLGLTDHDLYPSFKERW